MNIRYPIYEGVYRILTFRKGKEPAFRYRSREGRTHGEPSVSSRFPIPGTSGGDTKSWKSGPGRESDRSGGIQEEVSGSRSQSR